MQAIVELHSWKMMAVSLLWIIAMQQITWRCANMFWPLIRSDQNFRPRQIQDLRQTSGPSLLQWLSKACCDRSWSLNLAEILAINVLQKTYPGERRVLSSWSVRWKYRSSAPSQCDCCSFLDDVFWFLIFIFNSIIIKNSIRIRVPNIRWSTCVLRYFIQKIIWNLFYNSNNLKGVFNSNISLQLWPALLLWPDSHKEISLAHRHCPIRNLYSLLRIIVNLTVVGRWATLFVVFVSFRVHTH